MFLDYFDFLSYYEIIFDPERVKMYNGRRPITCIQMKQKELRCLWWFQIEKPFGFYGLYKEFKRWNGLDVLYRPTVMWLWLIRTCGVSTEERCSDSRVKSPPPPAHPWFTFRVCVLCFCCVHQLFIYTMDIVDISMLILPRRPLGVNSSPLCYTPPFSQIWIIFNHLKLWIASASHNSEGVKISIFIHLKLWVAVFKRVKITQIF